METRKLTIHFAGSHRTYWTATVQETVPHPTLDGERTVQYLGGVGATVCLYPIEGLTRGDSICDRLAAKFGIPLDIAVQGAKSCVGGYGTLRVEVPAGLA